MGEGKIEFTKKLVGRTLGKGLFIAIYLIAIVTTALFNFFYYEKQRYTESDAALLSAVSFSVLMLASLVVLFSKFNWKVMVGALVLVAAYSFFVYLYLFEGKSLTEIITLAAMSAGILLLLMWALESGNAVFIAFVLLIAIMFGTFFTLNVTGKLSGDWAVIIGTTLTVVLMLLMIVVIVQFKKLRPQAG